MVDKWCSYWGRIEGMSLNISPTQGYKKVILRIWYPLIIHGSGVHCAPAPLMMDRAELSSLYLIKCTDGRGECYLQGFRWDSLNSPYSRPEATRSSYWIILTALCSVCYDVFTVILSLWWKNVVIYKYLYN